MERGTCQAAGCKPLHFMVPNEALQTEGATESVAQKPRRTRVSPIAGRPIGVGQAKSTTPRRCSAEPPPGPIGAARFYP